MKKHSATQMYMTTPIFLSFRNDGAGYFVYHFCVAESFLI